MLADLAVGKPEWARRRLYAIIVEADLFGYPNVFKPTGESSVEGLPPSDFTIAIQSDGRQHDIEWVDRSSLSPDATRLRKMLRAVRALLVELPSVQQLPQSRMFCL